MVSMIGEVIRKARFTQGLSLGLLSQQAGVHKSTLSRWESGKSVPYTEELERVFTILDIEEKTRKACWSALGVPRAERHLKSASHDPLQDMAITGGELMRALRLRSQLSQEEAARLIGVTQGTFSQWEHNDAWPTPEKLSRLCEVLGATPGEMEALRERQWRGYSELPRDKEAMDAYMYQLDKQDTVLEKGLIYLALAGRYWQLFREHQISEVDAVDIWGHYADHLCRAGMVEAGIRVARATYDAIAQTKGTLSIGQVHAFGVVVDGGLRGIQAVPRKMELRRPLESRIPQSLRSYWLDNVAMDAWHLYDNTLFSAAYEASAEEAGTSAGAAMRRQRYARMLCIRGRYTDALHQLQKNASAGADSRVSVVSERLLISCWALLATGDRIGARRELDASWELLNQHPHFYDRDQRLGLARVLTTKLAA